jgi:DNA-binding GntR family transcriptional regulator
VETLVLRLAVEHGSVGWESALVAAHHRLERTPQMDTHDTQRLSDDWVAAHAAYHDALLAGCPNPRLLGVATSLRDSAELYRRWSVPMAHAHRDIAGEHRALRDAALAHDADLATSTLAAHIQGTTNVLLQDAAVPIDQPASA